jgi:hypothetical protein
VGGLEIGWILGLFGDDPHPARELPAVSERQNL